MKKNSSLKMAVLISLLVSGALINLNAQVTVGGNTTPRATLDVVAISGYTEAQGVIAPNLAISVLDANQAAYTAAQTGAIVYVYSVAGSSQHAKTVKVDKIGYYYFDGLIWQPFGSVSTDTNDKYGAAYGLGKTTAGNAAGDFYVNMTAVADSLPKNDTFITNMGDELSGDNNFIKRMGDSIAYYISNNDLRDTIINLITKYSHSTNVIRGNLSGRVFVANEFWAQQTVLLHCGTGFFNNLTLPNLTMADIGKTLVIVNRGTSGTIQAYLTMIDNATSLPYTATLPMAIALHRPRGFMWIGDAWVEATL